MLAGIALGVLGLLCIVSGVTLLAWRVLEPDAAVLIPPGFVGTPVDTPTPGVLGTALAIPPLPDLATPIAILPVSERPTPTASPIAPSTGVPERPSPQPPASPSPTPIPTQLFLPSPSATVPVPTQITPTGTPTGAPPTETYAITTAHNPPVRIMIDRIALDAPVVPVGQHPIKLGEQIYSQWDVPPARAAGWHQTSAPLGTQGNTVLNGHHNIYGEVFRYLNALKPGDIITLESETRRYQYIVAQTMTLPEEGQPVAIRQENARWILPTDDERVTLVTCWPYLTNTHRLVVIALPLWEVVPPSDIP